LTTIAIIPARGGSKSIPNKNIVKIAGKPLIQYTIDAARSSKLVDKVVVSSDSEEILNISEVLGAECVQRPGELAQDTTPTAPVIGHVISYFANQNQYFDQIVLLQPTSPLRTSQDIDDALSLLQKTQKSNLISVVEPAILPHKCFVVDDDGFLRGVVDDESPFMRRQDLPQTYYPNGAIYIFETQEFLKTNQIPMEAVIPFVMPPDKSTDIDTFEDIKKIEQLLEKEKT